MPASLTARTLKEGLQFLAKRDASLAQILRDYGPPPMWAREPGFKTLLLIILEQQVSLASAKAAYDRLLEAASPLTPERLLQLSDETLRAAGFSRQKTAYARHLAHSIIDGHLDLHALGKMDDREARSELMNLKGIGQWTADIYLLRALRRPDIFPVGDLALVIAAQRIKRLDLPPAAEELERMAARWRPWRAVAARLLWHYYLHNPRRR